MLLLRLVNAQITRTDGFQLVAGVVTAIWAGFIASIFGGCSYNIVGPTGALSGIFITFLLGSNYKIRIILNI